jgi:O-antigen/teichoic acid export membrane protein
MAAIGILSIPGQFGLPPLVTREVAAALPSADSGLIRGVVSWATRFSWGVSLVIAMLTTICALAYSVTAQGEVAKALLYGAMLVPFMTITRVIGGALRGLHLIVLGQIPDGIVRPLLNVVLLLLLFSFVKRPTAAEAMAAGVVAAAFSFCTARRILARNLPTGEARRAVGDAKRWIGSAIPLALTNGLRALEGNVGVLFLGFMATEADAGYFRLAVALAVLFSTPTTLVGNTVIPIFARLFAADDLRTLQRVVTHAARAQFGGVLLVSAPFFVAPRLLLTTLFGANYAPAASVVVLIAVAQLISTAFGPNGNLLNMTGHERRVNFALAISLTINVVTTAALIPLLGLTGAAWAWILGTFAWNLVAWQFARKFLGINTFILARARA